MSGNQALNTNYPVFRHADLEITTHGSDWYFAVCAVMAVSTLVFVGLSFRAPRAGRLFHYITALITFVAAIAYFSMGANLGQTPITAEFPRPNSAQVFAAGTREIFYVRYIDWFVTTPLLLLDLMLTAGLPWPTILMTIIVDEVMIVTGLVGALVQTSYKWGYWVFGTLALFFVTYQLLGPGRKSANALGGNIKSTYNSAGLLLIFVWMLYPIAWGVSEGGNLIHPDSEAIFYGVLDIIAKPVYGAILLWGHRNIDPAALGLHIRDTGAYHDKTGTTAGHGSGHHNGVTDGNTINNGNTLNNGNGINNGTGVLNGNGAMGHNGVHPSAGGHHGAATAV